MRRVVSGVSIQTGPLEVPSSGPAPQSPTSPLPRTGSQLRRRTVSGRQLGKKKASASISQRMELARRRMDAALMIQRAWHRWYVSFARRKRIEAARKIQHAWAGTFHVANAKRELQFLRWLKERRDAFRNKWKSLLRGLELRRRWAAVVIAGFKNVYIWKRRIIARRRHRFARCLQRWWRQLMYNRRTRGTVLAAVELCELLRLEKMMRVLVAKEYRTSVVHVIVAGREVLAEGQARTLKRWHEVRHVPYEVHPQMEAALARYDGRVKADEAMPRPPRYSVDLQLSSVANAKQFSASSLREVEEVNAFPAATPCLVPSRPMSSRGREQAKTKFSIAVRPPSATVRNSRRPQRL
jgi:hypothetical protein